MTDYARDPNSLNPYPLPFDPPTPFLDDFDPGALLQRLQDKANETLTNLANGCWPTTYIAGVPRSINFPLEPGEPREYDFRRDQMWVVPDNADFSWGLNEGQIRAAVALAQAHIRELVDFIYGTPLCDQEIPAKGTE